LAKAALRPKVCGPVTAGGPNFELLTAGSTALGPEVDLVGGLAAAVAVASLLGNPDFLEAGEPVSLKSEDRPDGLACCLALNKLVKLMVR
jgi:hypothetical protein